MNKRAGPTISERHPPISRCDLAQTFTRNEQAKRAGSLPADGLAIPKIEYRGWFSLTEALHYPSRGRVPNVEKVKWFIPAKREPVRATISASRTVGT